MSRIPLPPLDMDPEPFRQSREVPAAPRKRRSIFGKAFRGIYWLGSTPVQWLGTKNIREGATLIADLASRVRGWPRRDRRFRTEKQGDFDLRATAFSYGITVAELERRLSRRRRLVFFVAWLLQVLAADGAGRRLLLAVDFLPFCLLFMLLAFYQALVNFQIRMERTASWRDYLMTDCGFWPRL
jgi:hypothetical protein